MPRLPLNVVLSKAAQSIANDNIIANILANEDTVGTSTQSRSDDGLTEYDFLRSEYSCKDCQSMVTRWDWHRQAPGTYPKSQVGKKSDLLLDGSNIAD